ncbi:MAG: PQQ-binding-like beta-propeller repeat protein, partial [Chloroflexi bacterium]|nr:PQQ-binding-like beta-propeller repeat protein [Chloroflexota bacterium]
MRYYLKLIFIIWGLLMSLMYMGSYLEPISRADAPSGPFAIEGTISAIGENDMQVRADDGRDFFFLIRPNSRILIGSLQRGHISDLNTGDRIRARLYPTADGSLVATYLRLLPLSGYSPSLSPKSGAPTSDRAVLPEQVQVNVCSSGGGGSGGITGDWPMLAHDAIHTAYNDGELSLAPPLNQEWVRPDNDGYTLASPAVVGQTAYVGTYSQFLALDIVNQSVVWQQPLGASEGDNELSSPAVVNNQIYYGTWMGNVVNRDATTGAVNWMTNLINDANAPQIYSPVVSNGTVYVAVDSYTDTFSEVISAIYALDAGSGAELWHTNVVTTSINAGSDPVISGGMIYLGTTDMGVYALDLNTHAVVWHFPLPAGGSSGVNYETYLTVQNGLVYIPVTYSGTTTTSELYAVDANTGTQVWVYTPSAPAWPFSSSTFVYGGTVLQWLIEPGNSANKMLVALDAATGNLTWSKSYSDSGADGGWWWQTAANGVLYRSSASLYVNAYDLYDGTLLWSYDTGTSVETLPVPAGGKLSFVDVYGSFYVFGHPAGGGGICGSVYEDRNANGLRDPGDPGLAGVEITLLGAGTSLTTTTDIDGDYGFTQLAADVYTVTATNLAGYLSVAANPGTTGGTALDADTISDIPLAAGASSDNNDFGDTRPVTVSGLVFDDSNYNGLFDSGEVGLAGITVTLANNTDTLITNTAADGTYQFVDVWPGNWTLTESTSAAYFSTTPDVYTLTLLSGEAISQDFGDAAYNTLAGIVYEDYDGNGVRDPGENGVSGVTVALSGSDYQSQAVNLSVQTDANGAYSFAQLLPGDYTLLETDLSGYLSVAANPGSQGGTATDANTISAISLTTGVQGVDNDFGDALPVRISGLVFDDQNVNQIADGGESGLAGVTISLNTGASTISDSSGFYSFVDLLPGTYQVTAQTLSGYFSTTPDVVDLAPLGSGQSNDAVDFGDARYASLSGSVYDDVDGSGDRGATENGLANVLLNLSGADYLGQNVDITVYTDGTGDYTFTNLIPGTYTLSEQDPAGYVSTVATVGSAGGAATDTNTISSISLSAGVDGVGYDFGDWIPPTPTP